MKPELSGCLQLELEALESHFVSALGTELWSSERAVHLITVDLSLKPCTVLFLTYTFIILFYIGLLFKYNLSK